MSVSDHTEKLCRLPSRSEEILVQLVRQNLIFKELITALGQLVMHWHVDQDVRITLVNMYMSSLLLINVLFQDPEIQEIFGFLVNSVMCHDISEAARIPFSQSLQTLDS